jgi:protease I
MKTLVSEMYSSNKPIAAICHGPWMLCSCKKKGEEDDSDKLVPICHGLRVTSFVAIKDDLENAGAIFVDEAVVNDHNVITSRTPQDLTPFCHEIIAALTSSK